MEQRKETIICLEGLGKQFQTTNGTVTALDDINLEILKGEIFGIIGLSGAGKSTLVRCINYLEHDKVKKKYLQLNGEAEADFFLSQIIEEEGGGDSESQTVDGDDFSAVQSSGTEKCTPECVLSDGDCRCPESRGEETGG